VWTNRPPAAGIDRTKGHPITWSGGEPGSYVYIVGSSPLNLPAPVSNGVTVNVQFVCTAQLGDGQFTVPAAALANLPPAANGNLYVASGSIQRFSAPGLDLGLLFFGSGNGIAAAFH
jgi:hypothetical protein